MSEAYAPRGRDLYTTNNLIKFWSENPLALSITTRSEGKDNPVLSVAVSLGEFRRKERNGNCLNVGDVVGGNYAEAVSAEGFIPAPPGMNLENVIAAELTAFEDLAPHLFVIVQGKLYRKPTECPVLLISGGEAGCYFVKA
jgi:hypothetical protein